jgi:hypothetical protein
MTKPCERYVGGGDEHLAALRAPWREVLRRIVGAVIGIDQQRVAGLCAQIDEWQAIDLGQRLVVLHAPHIALRNQYMGKLVPPFRAGPGRTCQIHQRENTLLHQQFGHGQLQGVAGQRLVRWGGAVSIGVDS